MSKEYKATRARHHLEQHRVQPRSKWCEIEDYNRYDVRENIPLLEKLVPMIDSTGCAVPRPLRRRRGGPPWSLRGIPVDVGYCARVGTRLASVAHVTTSAATMFSACYDKGGSFREDRFAAPDRGPGNGCGRATTTGRPELKGLTLAQAMSALFPELIPLQRLRRHDCRVAARSVSQHDWR